MEALMEKLIAYCGLNCAGCGAYLALKNNDQALREKTANEWQIAHNFEFTAEMINCVGCQNEGIKTAQRPDCPFVSCCRAKGVDNCGKCSNFKTCEEIQGFIKAVPHVAENLG
jgi:hypothetical protein